jgi:sarcosine oxidase subunit delta
MARVLSPEIIDESIASHHRAASRLFPQARFYAVIRITCPYCGCRDHSEFSYVGDATVSYPPLSAKTDTENWFDSTYLRDNPRGPHLEYWQHVHGCRTFVKVLRDTATHEVLACGLPGDDFEIEGPK